MAKTPATQSSEVIATPPEATADTQLTRVSRHWGKHEHTILVIQGGGALGAYQAGVYAGLEESELAVDWVTGVSIGAINTALIAGNPLERRDFDNTKMPIRPEHVMASGALPPGFPPVNIDGELYWDGGIVSNSPLWYVTDEAYRADALIFQIDLFSGAGEPPQNIDQVQERAKDIQYSSKTRFNASRVRELEEIRASLRRVIEKLPEALQSDPDVQRLKAVSTRGAITLVHFINRHNTYSSNLKDCEFSRATVSELWKAGHDDVRHAMNRPELSQVTDLGHGIRIFDATR
jgi:NTE family protein